LRELGEVEDVDIVLYDEDFPNGWFDEDAEGVTNQHKVMARIMESWRERELTGASRRLHLHFYSTPVEILGDDKVSGIKFERTGTGIFFEQEAQAVYRAIGYFGSELPDVPFDDKLGVITSQGGRVADGVYATGWIKRGPVGLIGHTKSDATETIENLITDIPNLADPAAPGAVLDTLNLRGVQYTDWQGWLKLDSHERNLGEKVNRERIKVVDRDEQVKISRG
jgi:ferredoxin--NADP+ reductase